MSSIITYDEELYLFKAYTHTGIVASEATAINTGKGFGRTVRLVCDFATLVGGPFDVVIQNSANGSTAWKDLAIASIQPTAALTDFRIDFSNYFPYVRMTIVAGNALHSVTFSASIGESNNVIPTQERP